MKETFERAMACKHWRWMPGMKWRLPEGTEACWPLSYRSGRYPEVPEGLSVIPDLTDPATLGCLLALVREAWDMPRIATFCADGWWGVHSPILKIGFPFRDKKDNSEAAALVKALEAAG